MSRFNMNRLPPTRRDRTTVMFVFRGKARRNSGIQFTLQPSNQSVTAGQTATFTVETTGGTAPITYQWQKLQPKAT